MARIQQSIEVGVPVHTAYHQLTQFEEYPRFMQDVEIVRQLDGTHLHWWARRENRRVEWDAEITEQQLDRSIAWRSTSGPANAGRVELQPVGAEKARVTLTIESEPGQIAGASADSVETAMSHRLEQDLARFKALIESHGAKFSASEEQDDRFSIAEEQNFDQQSDEARRIGQMPQDTNAADAMTKSMKPEEIKEREELRRSMGRSAPPSQ